MSTVTTVIIFLYKKICPGLEELGRGFVSILTTSLFILLLFLLLLFATYSLCVDGQCETQNRQHVVECDKGVDYAGMDMYSERMIWIG